jgi:hypothetical protein
MTRNWEPPMNKTRHRRVVTNASRTVVQEDGPPDTTLIDRLAQTELEDLLHLLLGRLDREGSLPPLVDHLTRHVYGTDMPMVKLMFDAVEGLVKSMTLRIESVKAIAVLRALYAQFVENQHEQFVRKEKYRERLFAAYERAREDQPKWNVPTLFEKLRADFPEEMDGLNKPSAFAACYRRWRLRKQQRSTPDSETNSLFPPG